MSEASKVVINSWESIVTKIPPSTKNQSKLSMEYDDAGINFSMKLIVGIMDNVEKGI